MNYINNEVYLDMIKSTIIFNYPASAKSLKVRLVIYNEKDKYFPFIFYMNSNYDKMTLNYKTLSPHFQYKYKYQVYKSGSWENLTEYKYFRIEFKDKNAVRYLLFLNPESKHLSIGFAGNGKRPSYHYVGTISGIYTNKLFILDNFSKNTPNKAAYYIGINGKKNAMKKVYRLIEQVRKQLNVLKRNVICIGSSKGGFASLLYALTYGYGHCIVGSPTIFLGNRLMKEGNMSNYVEEIAGHTSENAIKWLNELIDNEIIKGAKCDIHLLIGRGESRYTKHVIPFQKMVEPYQNINLELEVLDFEKHNDLVKYYPNYLREKMKEITNL